jgi:hypothetical protein
MVKSSHSLVPGSSAEDPPFHQAGVGLGLAGCVAVADGLPQPVNLLTIVLGLQGPPYSPQVSRLSTVHLFEKGETVRPDSKAKMVAAFAARNVEITNGEGTGARLRRTASERS